jgi:hypothetical protein
VDGGGSCISCNPGFHLEGPEPSQTLEKSDVGKEATDLVLLHSSHLLLKTEQEVKGYFEFWTMHFLKGNEKPTNALVIQCIGTQYSPTCFGTLKCHHQGVKHDPAKLGAQCREKQRRMGAVYCKRRRNM